MVVTRTVAAGVMPAALHLMFKNFSAPKSDPNPASVTAYSPCWSAAQVAMMLLHPWAMLAKGPPCTKEAPPSRVCTRFGLMASFNKIKMAPVAPKSFMVKGVPSYL